MRLLSAICFAISIAPQEAMFGGIFGKKTPQTSSPSTSNILDKARKKAAEKAQRTEDCVKACLHSNGRTERFYREGSISGDAADIASMCNRNCAEHHDM